MNKRLFFISSLTSALIGAITACLIIVAYNNEDYNQASYNSISAQQKKAANYISYDSAYAVPKGLNFVSAAQKVIPGVVHIRTLYSSGKFSLNALEGYFGNPTRSSGSGVIVSNDGYIITNNHVIEGASQIDVVLNDNRNYPAKIIGTDPTTDLALLKIKEQNLNFVQYGNSDKTLPGEWVLAIGNPFDLNSTVTAGIVSAKARNIGILRDKNNLQIEAFIQTDAAVNPGNSGGALVNLNGELIGINTAIATPNGSYAGYSFAVPVSLVKKVIDDLLEFGAVQRGLLGIRIADVNARIAEAEQLDLVAGVFISQVNPNSAAENAGLAEGDIIISINHSPTNNVSELQEMVARNRPGDQITVTYYRNQKKNTVTATLRNTEGTTEIIKKAIQTNIKGAVFKNLSVEEMKTFNIDGGVKIIALNDGKWKEAGVAKGFIITQIDKVGIANLEDLNRTLANKQGGILVEGINSNGDQNIYGINW